MMLLFALALALQTTPMAPMEKGTALPPPGAEEAAVLAPVNALLAAITARDAAAIAATLRPDGAATVAIEGPSGSRTIRNTPFAELPARLTAGTARAEERLGMPAIEIDGDIAMVWAPYTLLLDGKLDHCGTDHFSLARENGQWRIAALSWTSRTTGCSGQ